MSKNIPFVLNDINIDRYTNRLKVERDYQFREWGNVIPSLNFPSEWKIHIVPPYAGALIRFIVKHKDISVSVYLDGYSQLGSMRNPYWEIYPDSTGNGARYGLNDIDELLAGIKKSLEEPFDEN